MRLSIILTLINFCAFGQRTFSIDKSQTDSIQVKDYKLFSVSENIDINFIGRQIPKSKRFRPSREESIAADNLFKEQYVKARVDQYYKQFHDLDMYDDSTEIERAKRTYESSYRRIESMPKRTQKRRF